MPPSSNHHTSPRNTMIGHKRSNTTMQHTAIEPSRVLQNITGKVSNRHAAQKTLHKQPLSTTGQPTVSPTAPTAQLEHTEATPTTTAKPAAGDSLAQSRSKRPAALRYTSFNEVAIQRTKQYNYVVDKKRKFSLSSTTSVLPVAVTGAAVNIDATTTPATAIRRKSLGLLSSTIPQLSVTIPTTPSAAATSSSTHTSSVSFCTSPNKKPTTPGRRLSISSPAATTWSTDTSAVAFRPDAYNKREIQVPTFRKINRTQQQQQPSHDQPLHEDMSDASFVQTHARTHHEVKREFVETCQRLRIIKVRTCPVHKSIPSNTTIATISELQRHDKTFRHKDCTCKNGGMDDESVSYLKPFNPYTVRTETSSQPIIFNYDHRFHTNELYEMPSYLVCCLSDEKDASQRWDRHVTDLPDITVAKRRRSKVAASVAARDSEVNSPPCSPVAFDSVIRISKKKLPQHSKQLLKPKPVHVQQHIQSAANNTRHHPTVTRSSPISEHSQRLQPTRFVNHHSQQTHATKQHVNNTNGNAALTSPSFFTAVLKQLLPSWSSSNNRDLNDSSDETDGAEGEYVDTRSYRNAYNASLSHQSPRTLKVTS